MKKLCAQMLLFVMSGLQAGTYYTSTASGVNVIVIESGTIQRLPFPIPTPSQPTAFAFHPLLNKAYTANPNANAVSVIDTLTHRTTNNINTQGLEPSDITFIPESVPKVYAVNSGSNNISLIDAASEVVTALINVGVRPSRIQRAIDRHLAAVSNTNDNTVSIIDTINEAVAAVLPVGSGPVSLTVTPDQTKFYVSNETSNDGNSITITLPPVVSPPFPAGSVPKKMEIDDTNTTGYIPAQDSNSISVIDLPSNTLIASIPVPDAPIDNVISRALNKLYAISFLGQTIDVIDRNTNTLLTTIALTGRPGDILVNDDEHVLLVTNTTQSTVEIFDTLTDTLITSIPVDANPTILALVPGSTVAPFPPIALKTSCTKNVFLTQTSFTNHLTWKPPVAGPRPVAYRIFRDAALTQCVATVPANQLCFSENARQRRTCCYYIVSVSANGLMSAPNKICF